MTLQHYLVISAILFTLGVFAVLTRRNAISILMGIELILNSCNLNFAAFSRFMTPVEDINGQIIAIFGIVLAAAEAAVFLAIILAILQGVWHHPARSDGYVERIMRWDGFRSISS